MKLLVSIILVAAAVGLSYHYSPTSFDDTRHSSTGFLHFLFGFLESSPKTDSNVGDQKTGVEKMTSTTGVISVATGGARREAFRAATCNVLFEPYYARHCKHDVMPYTSRVLAWKKFVSDPSSMFSRYDIILLQEFASGDRDWTSVFDGTPFRLLTSKQPKKSDDAGRGGVDSTAVVYNTKTFREVLSREDGGAKVHSFGKGKSAIRVLLQNVADGSLVLATSAHLPWSPQSEPDEQVKTLRNLHDFATEPLKFEDESAALATAPKSFLVGGDFNIEPFKTQLRLAKNKQLEAVQPTSPADEVALNSEPSKDTATSSSTTTTTTRGGREYRRGGKRRDENPELQRELEELSAGLIKTGTTLPIFEPEQGWIDLTAGFEWSQMGRGGACRLDFIFAKEVLDTNKPPPTTDLSTEDPSASRELGSASQILAPTPDTIDVFPPFANQLVKHDKHDPSKYGPAYDEIYFSDHAFCGVPVQSVRK